MPERSLEVKMSKPAAYSFIFDRYRLSVAKRELLYEDHLIPINRIQFEILRILVENQGEFVKKDKLVADVCGNSTAGPNTIEQAIFDLRGKLHDALRESRFIETKRGKGYRFVANVRKVPDEDLNKESNEITEAASAAILDEKPSVQSRDEISKPPQHENESYIAEDLKGAMSTFEEWMNGPGKAVTWVLIFCVILTVTISIPLSVGGNTRKWAKPSACLAQFIVILIGFAHFQRLRGPKGFRQIKGGMEEDIKKATGYDNLREFDKAKDIAKKALQQYTKYWQWLLLSWLALYACLALIWFAYPDLSSLIAEENKSKQLLGFTLSITLTLFNNLNTLMLFLCFKILNKQIEDIEESRSVMDDPVMRSGLFFLGATLVEVLLLVPIEKAAIPEAASLFSGIAGGIAMALYVGRLQSKFLGARPWLLIALYSYTAIQPLFVYLEKNDVNPVMILNVALFLKCLLYLYMAWLFQSGRLLFYLVRVRRTYQGVKTEWQIFRNILE
jgi:DNA-binding winged helix-turn-helix (wHTH) protein